MKMTRHEMFVELVSDYISTIEDQVLAGSREELEEWLAPILRAHLAEEHKYKGDDVVAYVYESQLGTQPVGW